jgi:hypothetical protein
VPSPYRAVNSTVTLRFNLNLGSNRFASCPPRATTTNLTIRFPLTSIRSSLPELRSTALAKSCASCRNFGLTKPAVSKAKRSPRKGPGH